MEQAEKPRLEDLLDDKSKIMEQIRAMSYNFYKNYGCNTARGIYSKEDLEREGILAVTRVYQKYDPSRGAEFMTYAYPYIRNAMLSCCRRNSHALSISQRDSRKDMSTLNDINAISIEAQEENGVVFDIPVGSGYDYANETVEHYFRGFSDLEQNILQDHLLNDLTLREISDKYNIKKCTARNIIVNGKDRIREMVLYEDDN